MKVVELSSTQDRSTWSGATDLARIIQAHWWDRGFHKVDVYAELLTVDYYIVKSNLVNGLPPR